MGGVYRPWRNPRVKGRVDDDLVAELARQEWIRHTAENRIWRLRQEGKHLFEIRAIVVTGLQVGAIDSAYIHHISKSLTLTRLLTIISVLGLLATAGRGERMRRDWLWSN